MKKISKKCNHETVKSYISNLPVSVSVHFDTTEFKEMGTHWDEKYLSFKNFCYLFDNKKELLVEKGLLNKHHKSYEAFQLLSPVYISIKPDKKVPLSNNGNAMVNFASDLECISIIILNYLIHKGLVGRRDDLRIKENQTSKEQKELSKLNKFLTFPVRTKIGDAGNIYANIIGNKKSRIFGKIMKAFKDAEYLDIDDPQSLYCKVTKRYVKASSSKITWNDSKMNELLVSCDLLYGGEGRFGDRITPSLQKLIDGAHFPMKKKKAAFLLHDGFKNEDIIHEYSSLEEFLKDHGGFIYDDLREKLISIDKLNKELSKEYRKELTMNGLPLHHSVDLTNTVNIYKDENGKYRFGRISNFLAGLSKSARLDYIRMKGQVIEEIDAKNLFPVLIQKLASSGKLKTSDDQIINVPDILKNGGDTYDLIKPKYHELVETSYDWNEEDFLHKKEINNLKSSRSDIKHAFSTSLFCESKYLNNTLRTRFNMNIDLFKRAVEYAFPNSWEAIRRHKWNYLFGEETKLIHSIMGSLNEEGILSIPVYDCIYVAKNDKDKAEEIFNKMYNSFIPECPDEHDDSLLDVDRYYNNNANLAPKQKNLLPLPSSRSSSRANSEKTKTYRNILKFTKEFIEERWINNNIDETKITDWLEERSTQWHIDQEKFIHNNLEKEYELKDQYEFKKKSDELKEESDESIDHPSNEIFEILNEYSAEKVFEILKIDMNNIKSRI